jgi:hypothetical protein
MRTGQGFSAHEQMLPMVRGGVEQETYWNYSFTRSWTRRPGARGAQPGK